MKTLSSMAALVVLGGCATLHDLSSEVSSFSRWPSERRPATYAFEQLPSQQAQPEQQHELEEAAKPAIEAAGFTPAPDAGRADVTITLGARITPIDRLSYGDPFWWGAGLRQPFAYGPHGRLFWGPGWYDGWGARWNDYGYQREVALLIRDRASGQALYEARVSNDGYVPMAATALPAMFRAALHDFPRGAPDPHPVTVELAPRPQS
jgi:hypothetical protein